MASFSQNYEVFASLLHGNGVKSRTLISHDEIVLEERPLCCMQSLSNKQDVVVCASCFKFIGSSLMQFEILKRSINRSNDLAASNKIGEPYCFPCRAKCGEYYCSTSCQEAHWSCNHSLMCTGSISEDDADSSALLEFKIHAVSTNEIFLMCGDVFSSIISNFKAHVLAGLNKNDAVTMALAPYEGYVRELWWDAAVAPKGSDAKKLRTTLRRLVKDSWELLSDALQLPALGLEAVLSKEFLARLIGMFEQNNVGVRLSSPLANAVLRLTRSNSSICGDSSEDVTGLTAGDQQGQVQVLLEAAQAILRVIGAEPGCDDEACGEWQDDEEDEEIDQQQANNDEEEEEAESEKDEEEEGDDNEAINGEDYRAPLDRLRSLLKIPVQSSSSSSSSCDADVTYSSTNTSVLDRVFPPLDGTAFYSLICKINHSCTPNVIVRYGCNEGQGLVAQLTALRDIQEGEELVQSYIDTTLTYKKRQAALADYGFRCRCNKCLSEAPQ